jgi:hypothetical protein
MRYAVALPLALILLLIGVERSLAVAAEEASPASRLITSFEQDPSPFSGDAQSVVEEHATDGSRALRLDRSYTACAAAQDWSGFDYVKADVYTDADAPIKLYIEVRDDKTQGYWTRVNYHTVIPPGASTVILPTNLYVGEKSRPGRSLDRAHVTRLVFNIGGEPAAPVYFDNVRLERDDSASRVTFDGLLAFDFGKETSPLMEGFARFTAATTYSAERGYGLEKADVWKEYDALQPEPLYEDFLCIRSGGLAIDLPNGKYRVFINIDSPSGFWGEYQVYGERSISAEGESVVVDRMDFDTFQRKYFRFWDVEDLPTDDVFDKYQEVYFDEKEFEVEVDDGQLNLEFQGQGWAISLSALVVYPVEREAEGREFLDFVNERRRFHFGNYFKRVLYPGTRSDFEPSPEQVARGMVLFARDYMRDVSYNDRPESGELASSLSGAAFAGEYEPVTFSVLPLGDLGMATVSVSGLVSGDAVIPASAIDVGHVSYRLSRVVMDGSVYTIAPRFVMPEASVDMPAAMTRRFWLTVRVPVDTEPGVYRGSVELASPEATASLPLVFEVYPGRLDPVDIPVGPWGHAITTQWPSSDPRAREYNDGMSRKSLVKIREYGFTSCSGLPVVRYGGFEDGEPQLDFSTADAQMERAHAAGFEMPIVNYCSFGGLNLYYRDTAAMEAAGFDDYGAFVEAIFAAVQRHADAAGWLPVYWNLGDEPIGDNLVRSAENARAYRRAFPEGPPHFTAATSFTGDDVDDPHFALGSALHVANFNSHSEESIALIHGAGSDWAFYNGGNRWTFGTYMYKAAKEFGMKFRLAWHWNVVAGDPYYALDCREDDYAWCNSSPDGRLIPQVRFERLREGLDDYRMLLTLTRLAGEKEGTSEAEAAARLIAERMGSFALGQRSHDAIFPVSDWSEFRRKMAGAIAALR